MAFLNSDLFRLLSRHTYKWEKYFVPLFRNWTSNQFTLKDSFEFTNIICERDAGFFIESLDADSRNL